MPQGLVEQEGKVYSERDGAEMVLIPAGEFFMGSDKREEETPPHRVYLNAFYIDRYEVSNGQFKKFLQETGYPFDSQLQGSDDYPYVNVSWYDALAYANWAGKQLPTEAQWEKAARGTDGRTYPWGEQWEASRLNVSGQTDPYRGLAPVNSFPLGVSPYGCHNTAGNVWEWCADWFSKDYYKVSPSRNPQGPASGQKRVIRGGSWRDIHYKQDVTRCSARVGLEPTAKYDCVGFRCVVPAGSNG